jgi:hypothetical protein
MAYLIEISGPFLSLPVLMGIFLQGIEGLDRDGQTELHPAYEEWLDELEVLQLELSTSEEKDQMNPKMDALRRRLLSIPYEIEQEKKVIFKRFSVPQIACFQLQSCLLYRTKFP